MIKWANRINIPSFLDSSGAHLIHALKEKPHCVHLNKREILTYTGANSFEKAQDTLSKLCKVSAITDGDKGLYYTKGKKTLHSLYKIEKVYSTIGSGDCLLAGIVAGHINQLEDQDIANLGAACGAANCKRTELGMLYKADVENLLST